MAEPQKIKWTKSQQQKLRKAVKNFNARLKTAQKNAKNIDLLPTKQFVKQAKQNIYSRKDLEKYIKSLETFTAETAQTVANEYGVQSTIWKILETKRRVKSENARRRAKEKQRKKVYSQGVEITGAELMARKNENKPFTFDFSKFVTQVSFDKFVETFEQMTDKKRGETDPQIYKEEINKALDKVGITDIVIRAMYNAIGDKLLDLYTAGHESANIKFIYDDKISTADKEEEMRLDLFSIIHELGYYKEFFEELQKLTTVPEILLKAWKRKGYKNTFEMLEHGEDIFILDNF